MLISKKTTATELVRVLNKVHRHMFERVVRIMVDKQCGCEKSNGPQAPPPSSIIVKASQASSSFAPSFYTS